MRAEAQITINVMVIDKDQHPVSSATILLLNPSDSSMVKGGITEESGHFQFQHIMPGSYILSVSLVGYETQKTGPFKVTDRPVHMEPVILL